ncbi:MAG: 4Fe-4S binding protein [Candidatus Heimdallarchaeota archaeon]|nr:MAG: 4Fe-4S binding protein [Candidatus Heimdallarchaeota archaeon]
MTEILMDPYERLAETLNKIPNGFTKTEDGTHLKVLQWIYTPDEADLASKLNLIGETVEELSLRLSLPIEGLSDKLENMAKKGQIYVTKTDTERRYGIMPFAVGIYEEQLERMDPEFAQLIEEYFQKAESNNLFDTQPSIFRVIPVNRVINKDPKLTIHTYEEAESIINKAKSWGIRECICKKQKSLLGQPCEYPTTVCLTFSSRENAYNDETLSKPVTKENAIELLQEAEEAGLIHCTMNIQSGHYYICNCCTCCCGVLRGLTERNQPLAFVKANFIMSVDEELCTGCAICVDRCQFDALDIPEDICEVDLQRCVGCGVCAIACPEQALSLVERHPSEPEPPPSIRDWMTQKAISRQVDPSDLI